MKYKCPKCGTITEKRTCPKVIDPLLWGTIMSDGYTDAGICSTQLEDKHGIREERTERD